MATESIRVIVDSRKLSFDSFFVFIGIGGLLPPDNDFLLCAAPFRPPPFAVSRGALPRRRTAGCQAAPPRPHIFQRLEIVVLILNRLRDANYERAAAGPGNAMPSCNKDLSCLEST